MTAGGGSGAGSVLVLGAGIAGLAAARALLERGVSVTVLEARERVGGRVLSQRSPDGTVVELGAEFVHGRAPELWALIKESGANAVERGGIMLREEEPGQLQGEAEDGDDQEDLFAPLLGLEELPEDMPFAQWLAQSGLPEWQKPALIGYVEGFNAADANVISAQALGVQQRAEAETSGDRAWHIEGGYAKLAEFLAERVRALGGEIRTGCVVRELHWEPGAVVVELESGERLRAERCVVTLPLGVLQRVNGPGGIVMRPEPKALGPARRLAMGEAQRFTLLFRERWWERSAVAEPEALRAMSFLFTRSRMPPVWWTTHAASGESKDAGGSEAETGSQAVALTGWVGGPSSRALTGRSTDDLATEACRVLGDVFGVPKTDVVAQLIGIYMHDWSADPCSLGAYSYVPAGALHAPAAMAEPEAGTLFFAGEHTDTTGHWGTVHAALRTGLRAAQQVLGALHR